MRHREVVYINLTYNLRMSVRVNLMMPSELYRESKELVEKGHYSNYSELVRQAVRTEVANRREIEFNENDLRLLALIKKAEKDGRLLTEEDMAKRGLRL